MHTNTETCASRQSEFDRSLSKLINIWENWLRQQSYTYYLQRKI